MDRRDGVHGDEEYGYTRIEGNAVRATKIWLRAWKAVVTILARDRLGWCTMTWERSHADM